MSETKTYEPGIHLDLPAAEYHRLDMCSNSFLFVGILFGYPAEARGRLDRGDPKKDFCALNFYLGHNITLPCHCERSEAIPPLVFRLLRRPAFGKASSQ